MKAHKDGRCDTCRESLRLSRQMHKVTTEDSHTHIVLTLHVCDRCYKRPDLRLHDYQPQSVTPSASDAMSELEKWAAFMPQARTIGDFLEWCSERNWTLCDLETGYPTLMPRQEMMCQYGGINRVKLENERQALVDSLRSQS